MKALVIATAFIVGSMMAPLSSLHASPLTSSTTAVDQPSSTDKSSAAHANDDYRSLASHYRQQEQAYRAKAAEEKAEWDRRKQVTGSIAEKYPRPVDSARNLYEYYAAKADQLAQKATESEARADVR